MNVLDKIVSSKRLPVLFIGSGIPKRYLDNFPSWSDLLRESFAQIDDSRFSYSSRADEYTRQNLSNYEIYMKLGTDAENEYNKAFFNSSIKVELSEEDLQAIERGTSPYRLFLRDRFSHMKLKNDPTLQNEMSSLSELKNKISAIITTNYDEFIESQLFGDDYTVFTNQHELFGKDTFNISELYKIHGSITDSNSIIINENDYQNFDDSRKLFIAKLLILFTESPIIFLGYSFTDENIRNIVSDFMGCLSQEQLSSISDNFIFITYKEGEQELVEEKKTIITSNSNDISITEISTDNFLKIYETLNTLVPGMTPKNIRNTQRLVKRIVTDTIANNDDSNIILGIENISEEIENKNLAIAIGYKETLVQDYGYSLLKDSDIFEDIIFCNKNFDANQMCTLRLANIASTRLLPVHTYINKSTVTLDEASKLKQYHMAHSNMNQIITDTYKKKNLNTPVTFSSVDDCFNYYNELNDIVKTFKVVLASIDTLDKEDLRNICKHYFHSHKDILMKNSNFKRVVMCIDLLENKKIPTPTL